MKKIINTVLLFILFMTSVGAFYVSKTVTKTENLIYIDPGHGGPDGGAVGIDGVHEKDIVLKIALKLEKYLKQAGYNVLLTRTGDYDLAPESSENRKREDIYKRVAMINSSNCLLYVSLHLNKFSSPMIYGAQVFYKTGDKESEKLSNDIQETIKSILQNTDRVAKTINDKYLIDNTKKVGSLVEMGFLSNPDEIIMLQDDFYQEKIAYSIYLGIATYLATRS
jgi:N-acetylmuramoyl-L-alanine amidase